MSKEKDPNLVGPASDGASEGFPFKKGKRGGKRSKKRKGRKAGRY